MALQLEHSNLSPFLYMGCMIPIDHSSGILCCIHINLIRWWIFLHRIYPRFFKNSANISSVPGALWFSRHLITCVTSHNTAVCPHFLLSASSGLPVNTLSKYSFHLLWISSFLSKFYHQYLCMHLL